MEVQILSCNFLQFVLILKKHLAFFFGTFPFFFHFFSVFFCLKFSFFVFHYQSFPVVPVSLWAIQHPENKQTYHLWQCNHQRLGLKLLKGDFSEMSWVAQHGKRGKLRWTIGSWGTNSPLDQCFVFDWHLHWWIIWKPLEAWPILSGNHLKRDYVDLYPISICSIYNIYII